MKNKLNLFRLVLLCLFMSVVTSTLKAQYSKNVVTYPVHTNIAAYYEYLPPEYAANPTKKFPLLISLHGANGMGDGSPGQIGRVLTDVHSVVPRRINGDSLPTSFTVNGQTHSFVVIAPQYSNPAINPSEINAVIDHISANYRIDTSRIYLIGTITGGRKAWNYAGNVAADANRLAALALANPSLLSPLNTFGTVIGNSNLPTWLTANGTDSATSNWVNIRTATNHINATSPDPAALRDSFPPGPPPDYRDSYNILYNPAFKKNGLNVYEWMLQYNSKKLQPNAGPDQGYTKPATGPTPSITLDGSKSRARAGRITSYAWTQISGTTVSTIASASSAVTSVSGLTFGEYKFKLTITHTDASTASDTVVVSTQSLIMVPAPAGSYGDKIKGYLRSVPATYYNDSTKYPLLICFQGNGQLGDGSLTDLDKMDNIGIPRLIADGKFPASFNVNGKDFSFIVLAPQLVASSGHSSTIPQQINKMIDSCVKYFRVDTTRIYMTGLSLGGGITWMYNSISASNTGKMAAIIPIATSRKYYEDSAAGNLTRVNIIGASNLPVWATANSSDPPYTTYTSDWITRLNAFSPLMNPASKVTIFSATGHEGWTQTYNPSNILDVTNNLNAYQWLLQYTNVTLTADAGPDQTITLPKDSVILDGRKSLARNGRCSTYLWSKISGPSATIDTVNKANPKVKGLTAGTYLFKLTVTHTNGINISVDTVQVTVNAASPRQAGPEEKLTPVDDSKKFLDVKLNPNPVRSNLTVFVSGKATGNASLALYNLQGQKVSQQQFNKPSAQTVARNVQVSNLPSGAYAIQVVLAGKTKTIQFIKE